MICKSDDWRFLQDDVAIDALYCGFTWNYNVRVDKTALFVSCA